MLARLVAEAVVETKQRRAVLSRSEVERRAANYSPRDFAAGLRASGLAVIAEMKQRTPSMGVLVNDYLPANLAADYERGGAAAISVLTHAAGFGGSIEHLDEVRATVDLPILRKDFITDPYQVVEARAHGADAVLLIVAALPTGKLAELLNVATRLELAALVEVHDEGETRAAVDAGAQLIGVNHRDLRTFDVDLTLTERLRPLIPSQCILVAESGIKNRQDARRMRDAGADAVLVGELLMRAADPAQAISELRAG
ncbi:MAG TPA: indole-3-glycerol phosphate synthase TrpC [Candidatus Dormibacteraeota bacterium]|nr:indole-3-glycerol phosphate synthase TrpC [Candidatus Dormibacteraeota bacterium]